MLKWLKIYIFKRAIKNYLRRQFGRQGAEKIDAIINIIFELIDGVMKVDE